MKPKPLKLDPAKCSEMVAHYTGRFFDRRIQCSRKWSITRDDKHYCKQHDPVRVADRGQQRGAKYEFDTAQRAMGWVGCQLYDALEGLLNESGPQAKFFRKSKTALKAAHKYRELLKGRKL